MKTLSARPAEISVVCVAGRRSREIIINLLKQNGCAAKISGGAVCANIRASSLKKLLPRICEHSERVYAGKYYAEIFSEHREG